MSKNVLESYSSNLNLVKEVVCRNRDSYVHFVVFTLFLSSKSLKNRLRQTNEVNPARKGFSEKKKKKRGKAVI